MFTPTKLQLQRYAQILVNFALNGGKGMNPGDTVLIFVKESAKPLYLALREEITLKQGNVILQYGPDESTRFWEDRIFYEHATEAQLQFAPIPYWKGMIESSDHIIFVGSQANPRLLEGIESSKIELVNDVRSSFSEMRTEKERVGKQSYTLCSYPTPGMAEEAGIPPDMFWAEVIKACYLDDPDPVAKWKKVKSEIDETKKILDGMKIRKFHITGDGVDLDICMGPKRKFLGLSGRNIPSYEIFTSPDYRFTEGSIGFNQPLYYQGKKISGIQLRFESGKVVHATATENEEALLQLIAQPGADMIGEFSLTDSRHSPITTLIPTDIIYMENMGGPQGNMHIALGRAYQHAYADGLEYATKEALAGNYFNSSAVHVDMVSTTKRTVTAFLWDGTKKVIYEDGKFTFF